MPTNFQIEYSPTESTKCGQFGCECTVAHAVIFRPLSDDGRQSRWLAAPDDVARVGAVQAQLIRALLANVVGILFLGFFSFSFVAATSDIWRGEILNILIVSLVLTCPAIIMIPVMCWEIITLLMKLRESHQK